MTKTSQTLSDDLKQHAAKATEQRMRFIADAQASREDMKKSGMGYDADEVHANLKAKVAGTKAAKPKARSWRA